MSDLKVTIERLEVFEHPNADALELAQVGLYRAVVPKGVYRSGDLALYIPEQAVLPPELIEELGLTGRLAGKDKNRVKAVRLRGEVSQGIVCQPAAIGEEWELLRRAYNGGDAKSRKVVEFDWAQTLGITKWVPPIPVGMAGQVESAPELIRWIEIENIKRYPDIFKPGEMVVATEKIHGTCCLYTLTAEGVEYVSSKGVGANHLAIKEDPRNVYWRAVRQHKLRSAAGEALRYYGGKAVGLFGEVYGKGVQDLHYGADAGNDQTLGYALFDVKIVPEAGQPFWLERGTLEAFITGTGVSAAPLVYQGPYDYGLLNAFANVRGSMLDPGTLREGLVVRPREERHSDVLGGRAIAKFVSEAYLMRKGGTEFE